MVQKEGLDRILTALPGENGNGKRVGVDRKDNKKPCLVLRT